MNGSSSASSAAASRAWEFHSNRGTGPPNPFSTDWVHPARTQSSVWTLPLPPHQIERPDAPSSATRRMASMQACGSIVDVRLRIISMVGRAVSWTVCRSWQASVPELASIIPSVRSRARAGGGDPSCRDSPRPGVPDESSVEDEVLREASLACPTGAIRSSAAPQPSLGAVESRKGIAR